MQLSLS